MNNSTFESEITAHTTIHVIYTHYISLGTDIESAFAKSTIDPYGDIKKEQQREWIQSAYLCMYHFDIYIRV